jgi:hypothetical protein
VAIALVAGGTSSVAGTVVTDVIISEVTATVGGGSCDTVTDGGQRDEVRVGRV